MTPTRFETEPKPVPEDSVSRRPPADVKARGVRLRDFEEDGSDVVKHFFAVSITQCYPWSGRSLSLGRWLDVDEARELHAVLSSWLEERQP